MNQPSETDLRELSARLDSLREIITERDKWLRELLAEHDRRITDQFSAQEKAVGKAESSQKDYNSAHNDLMKRLDAQARDFNDTLKSSINSGKEDLRREFNGRIETLSEAVDNLRESRDRGTGKTEGISNAWAMLFSVIGVVIGVGALLVALLHR